MPIKYPAIKKGRNTGVILQVPTASDKIFGSDNSIGFAAVVPSGDWRAWLPSNELQLAPSGFDTMSCVTFSALNSIETQLNRLIATNGISARGREFLQQNGYIDNNGKVNFSDRFTAKMSGTTQAGNTLLNVWNSIRNHGLLPDNDWPFTDVTNWATWAAAIPEPLKAKALIFKQWFEVKYEWVRYDLTVGWDVVKQNMQQAPLQIAAPICSPWNSGQVIKACGAGAGHATLMTYIEDSHINIFDHYQPFEKKLAPDYVIPYVMKGIIVERQAGVPNPQLLARLEGKYIQRVQAQGQVYKVEGGKLTHLEPDKQANGQRPLFDEWSKYLQAQGKLVGLTENDFNSINQQT